MRKGCESDPYADILKEEPVNWIRICPFRLKPRVAALIQQFFDQIHAGFFQAADHGL